MLRLLLLLAACTGDDGDDTGDLTEIPEDTLPCESPGFWSEALPSETHPLIVHYRPGEEDMAEEVLGYLDHSWDVEVDQLGFRPPLPDGDLCGDGDEFDVFVWDGLEVAYVDAIAENDATAHDDWFTYMAVDPWGPYGGDILDATLAHEFNHACQASDDWWDSPIVFEMTSTFMEDVVYDDDNDYATILVDFQSHPDWSLDRNDDYETWFMYASSLYLRYVRDRFYDGDAAFAADMWLAMRNPAGDNEPDFEDALDDLLGDAAGMTFLDSVVEFAKWRWYVGAKDDGAHFEEGATWPLDAEVAIAGGVATLPVDRDVDVMALGSAYVEITTGGSVEVSLADADAGVDWVFQVVPGAATDGDVLDLGAGPVVIDATSLRVIVATALPLAVDADPEDRTDAMFGATLHFEAL